MNSERVQGGVAVHYLYDLSKPDVLRIQLLYGEGTGKAASTYLGGSGRATRNRGGKGLRMAELAQDRV